MVTEIQAPPEFEVMPGAQWDFVMSDAMYPGLFSGRGGGKTVATVVKAIKYVTEHPGAQGVMTEPTFPMVRDILVPAFRTVAGHLEGLSVGAGWEFKRGDMQIVFSALKSTIMLRPAEEYGRLRGLTLAFFAMDEIAEGYQHEAFMILQPALRQEGYPVQGWVSSTPHWQSPWLRQRWVDKANPRTGEPLTAADYPRFTLWSQDNHHLPEGQIERLKESYGDTPLWAQEGRGEFIRVEGAAFPQFSEMVHVRLPGDTKFVRKVVGLDFGASSPTAAIELGITEQNRVWAIREFYKRNCTDEEWVSTLGEWGSMNIRCDPQTSGAQIESYQRQTGLPIRAARTNNFQQRFRLLFSRLTIKGDGQPGMYISPECPNLIAELQNLALAKPRGQDILLDKWEQGLMDHAYDAAAYGLMEFDYGGMPHPPKVKIGFPWRVR